MSTELIWQITSTGSADTIALGEILGANLSGGELIELHADLGGGKTTLTQGIASGLGSKDIVSSPTFTLSKIYKCRGGIEIHHFDFYRLTEPGVLKDQLAESLSSKNVVTIIEWSDIVADVLPEDRLNIELAPRPLDPDERQVTIRYPEGKADLIRKIETDWKEVRP
jgi:tRNA threonylcarbamoyladenosine biosynthesis protein TsaE